jgi:hypothetical protein
MPPRAHRKQTIKEVANALFLKVSYIDINGRNVGYDYDFILAEIKKKFAGARTSKRWLRKMAYEIAGTVRMPVRRRSRRALAEGYAMALLLRRGGGSVYGEVTRTVKKKFPEQHISADKLRRLDGRLRFAKFLVPPRP